MHIEKSHWTYIHSFNFILYNSINFEQNIFAEMQYIYYGNIEF